MHVLIDTKWYHESKNYSLGFMIIQKIMSEQTYGQVLQGFVDVFLVLFILSFIEQYVGIPPSLLSSVGHPIHTLYRNKFYIGDSSFTHTYKDWTAGALVNTNICTISPAIMMSLCTDTETERGFSEVLTF